MSLVLLAPSQQVAFGGKTSHQTSHMARPVDQEGLRHSRSQRLLVELPKLNVAGSNPVTRLSEELYLTGSNLQKFIVSV